MAQVHQNEYQETAFNEEHTYHGHGGGSKDDEGSSSESDFEYITEDSLLKSSLPSRHIATKPHLDHCHSVGEVLENKGLTIESKVSSDESLTVINCDFKHVGCEVRLPQKDMPAHLEQAVVHHLSKQAEAVKTLQIKNEELSMKHERLEKKYQHLESKVNELLKVSKKVANMKVQEVPENDDNNKTCDCEPQNSMDHSLKNTLPKGESFFLLPVPNMPLSPVRSDTVSANVPLSTEFYEDDGEYINADEMPEPKIVNKTEDRYSYVYVEPTSPLPMTKQPPTSGKLVMAKFEQHRRQSGDHWVSHPFYTHTQGYKMCLRVTANGEGSGKGTHITVVVYLMKGEFDDQLEWPFRGDITIRLLSQQGDGGHYARTIRGAEGVRGGGAVGEKFISAWGISQFKSNCEIYQKFLKNDSLKFQVDTLIKPSELSPQVTETEV